MRALLCREYGPVSRLQVCDWPAPVPGPRDVVVRVEAAGINYPDALLVEGRYQVRPPLPFVPGIELAGVVSEVGSGVGELGVGDPVVATAPSGAFAEACAVPVDRVQRRPGSIGADLAAAVPVTYGTALHALEDRAGLRAGETLLVLGAAGGVGTAAIEIGKLKGARVVAVASTAARRDLCLGLGADHALDPADGDLRGRLRELTGGRGVDVVFDPVGGALTEGALRSTGWGGRLLVIGFATGEIPRISLNLALLNGRSILGVFWGDWAQRERAASAAALVRIVEWLGAGRIRPAVRARLRLDEVPAALDDLLQRRAFGKLVACP
jgi:NADPH2:quinone reductase